MNAELLRPLLIHFVQVKLGQAVRIISALGILTLIGCTTSGKYKTVSEGFPGRDAVKFSASCRDLEASTPTIYLEARNDTLYRHDIELADFTLASEGEPIKPTGWVWHFRQVHDNLESRIRRSYPGARVPANHTIIIRMQFPQLDTTKAYRLLYTTNSTERTIANCEL